jgi:hypothetical protein
MEEETSEKGPEELELIFFYSNAVVFHETLRLPWKVRCN